MRRGRRLGAVPPLESEMKPGPDEKIPTAEPAPLVFERIGKHSSLYVWADGSYLHILRHVMPIRLPPVSRSKRTSPKEPTRSKGTIH